DYAKVAVLLDGEATTVKWDKEDEEFNHDEVLTKPGQVLYAIELDDNEIVSVDPFDADDNENFNEHHAVVTTTAASIDDLNRLWLEEEVTDESGAVKLVNKWYALDDEVVVYVYDKSDSAWTVKTASYLNGLKLTKTEAKDATKKIEINLYDTNDKDKEYYNVVIVVRP
ncbi:MAG: hypothetical protein HUJ80_07870, partial [Firmicutes bacterium]|nr:hypothetical protein [Bacillota bacterium]